MVSLNNREFLIIPLNDREGNGTTLEPDFLWFQSWPAVPSAIIKGGQKDKPRKSLGLWLWLLCVGCLKCWESGGKSLPPGQVGFGTGCTMPPLLRRPSDCSETAQSCREQCTCPTEFLNSSFLERPIKGKGQPCIRFSVFSYQGPGKECLLSSRWATPAPSMATEEIQNLSLLGEAAFQDPSELRNVSHDRRPDLAVSELDFKIMLWN